MKNKKLKALGLFEFKSRFTLVKRVIALFLILSFFSTGLSYSQMISKNPSDYPAGTVIPPTGAIVLPPVHLKVSTNYTIPLLVAPPYTITLTSIYGGCDEITNNKIVSNVNNVITVLVNKKCLTSEDNWLRFSFNISKSGYIPEYQVYTVPIFRDSLKVILTLDISGSMQEIVPGGSDTKIQTLKSVVNMFVPKLETFQQEGDSLGLTYYSSLVYQPDPVYFPKKFVKITTNFEPVSANYASYKVLNDLNPRVPLQMTAMAAGLMDAKNKLLLFKEKTPNTRRMVFLFTDGLQNWGSLVNPDGNSLNNGVDSLNNIAGFPKDSIRYYTVATWAASTGTTPEILSQIATSSGGEALVATPSTALEDWFNNQLCNMLSDGSPQIVFKKYSNNLVGSSTYSFNLNNNIQKVLLELSFKREGNTTISVEKDNVEIAPIKEKLGDRFTMLSFNFPMGNSGGKWDVTITGTIQNPFTVTAIADDHHFKFTSSLDKGIYTVGDTIHFFTKIAYTGHPISGAGNSIKAMVLKPGDDVGNLLSIYQTPPIDSTVDTTSAANYKFQQLMANDTSFYNALLPSEQIVELTDMGDGAYKGKYFSTEFAGIYNILFLINGSYEGAGKFERSKLVSSVFKFGQVVQEEPEVVDSNPPSNTTGTSNGKYLKFKIRPKNKFGYYMGPGFSSKIKVVINPGKKRISNKGMSKAALLQTSTSKMEPFVQEISDNLDGSYYILIANVPSGSNPNIQILVRDEILYSGKACPIPSWLYILLIILILLVVLIRYFKANSSSVYKILLWIFSLIVLVVILLQYFGVVRLFC